MPRYNIAPSQSILAILAQAGSSQAELLQWGLIPSWSRERNGFINARAETLEEKPSFSESFQRRRCLIPADGFYEWKKSGKSKQPYYFQLTDQSPFMFAGIWDKWETEGNTIASCAIITTTANELMAPVHDRMPVILRSENQDAWLRREATPKELKALLAAFPATEMTSFPVSAAVNRTEVDHEGLVEEIDPAQEPGAIGMLF